MIKADEIYYLQNEDYIKQVKEITASIRDQLNDIDILTEKFLKDGYWNQNEVAEYLHCTVPQIPRAIPCSHIGRSYLFKRSDVEKFIHELRKTRNK